MGEMGLGYGSEFQLLRFLGHHREELDKKIQIETRYKNKLRWLDFPYDSGRLSGDGESEGISFLKNHPNFMAIRDAWEKFWPQTGKQQNWDAIFVHDDEYVLVEAKAHLHEMKSSTKASDESRKTIVEAFRETHDFFGVKTENDWTKNYYQLANRLAFVKFMTDNKLKASLLYIYFVNGFRVRHTENITDGNKKKTIVREDVNSSVSSKDGWEEAIAAQDKYLGITGTKAMDYLTSLFVDCDPRNA